MVMFPEYIRIDVDANGKIELLDEDGRKTKLYIGGGDDGGIEGKPIISEVPKDVFVKLVKMILENGLKEIQHY